VCVCVCVCVCATMYLSSRKPGLALPILAGCSLSQDLSL
jgi:hypothetical protein